MSPAITNESMNDIQVKSHGLRGRAETTLSYYQSGSLTKSSGVATCHLPPTSRTNFGDLFCIGRGQENPSNARDVLRFRCLYPTHDLRLDTNKYGRVTSCPFCPEHE